MLRLARQGHRVLRSRFICTSCRALLASGVTRQPAAVAKLCAARHYSADQKPPLAHQQQQQQQQQQSTEKKPEGKVDKEEPAKKPPRDADKPKSSEQHKSTNPKQNRKSRRRPSSSAGLPPTRLQLWRETLKVLKDIKADKDLPPPQAKAKHAAAERAQPPATAPAPAPAPDSGHDAKPGKSEGPPREANLLEGALSVLKRVLRQELRDTTPTTEQVAELAHGTKRPAAASKDGKTAEAQFAPSKKGSATASKDEKTTEAEPAPGKRRPAAASKGENSTQAELPKAAAATLAAINAFQKASPGGRPAEPPAEKPAEEPAEEPAAKASKSRPTQPSKLLAALEPLPQAGNKKKKSGHRGFIVNRIDAAKIALTPIVKPQPPVPKLAYGLDRVLFNPGVYHMQDPRSRVFNFDPYLARIMPVKEFDFNAIKQYVTSSKDTTLIQTAAEHKKKYTGSTSSMTSTLAHFHYLLSAWRPINTSMMSKGFEIDSQRFTRIMRAPAATFLHWKDGTYAIDADKEFDTANILSMLGKSMEKFLTLPKEEFEKYRKTKSDQLTEEERNGPESYHYTTLGDFMMRSQLDAYDPRLPGTGMFDLKTRAVISIRMDASDFHKGLGYEIRNRFGQWESFEREYYDMIRSAFLKYSLQVRMGRMDGIFVAFHNTERIFGFQYIPLGEMDLSLHGQTELTLGDREFKLSLYLLNKVLDKMTAKFPGRTLRLHFETRGDDTPFMYVFAKPVTPTEVEEIQGATRAKVEDFERRMMGIVSEEERAMEEEDGGDEAVDEADEHDLDEDEGEEITSSAAWEDVMLKVEDELEDEEHGATFVREAIEDALQESGLLRTTAPDETQRYVDAFLEALTSNGRRAALEDQASPGTPGEHVAESKEAEPSVEAEPPAELSDDTAETDTTSSGAPETTENAEESSEEFRDEAQSPATEDASADEPTLKDMIVKLATRIRAIPSERRSPPGEEQDVIEEDVPEYAQRLRKIERILSELTEQPQEGDKTKEAEGSGVVETGSVSAEPGESAETAASLEQVEKKYAQATGEAESPATTPAGEEGETSASATPSPEAPPTPAAESPTKNYIDKADEGELYGLIVTVRNKVDGEYVERPEKLRPSQRWTVEYAMEEIKPERAHNLYKMVLKRRKNLLYPDEDSTGAEAVGDRDRWYYMFQGRLERYSTRGREFRRRETQRQRQQPVHVYGKDTPYTFESVFEDAKVDGTKPYEEWPGEPGKKAGAKGKKKKE